MNQKAYFLLNSKEKNMSQGKTEMSLPDQWNGVVAELVEENSDLIQENEGI